MIGIFDSGYGGLTVLKALASKLPQYKYLYLGDSARAPYGGHDKETILTYSRQAVDFLFGRGVRLIIMACNTVSAVALRQLQEDYLRQPQITDKKILGVIFPLAEKAVKISKNGNFGIVGTRATINSEAYNHELKKLRPGSKIYAQACPLLVPFIEEGWEQKPEAKMILRKYLRPLKSCHIDTLILGCTHYPLMQKQFRQVMNKQVAIPDTGLVVASSLENYLKRHPEIEKILTQNLQGKIHFMTTGDVDKFKNLGSRFFGKPITEVEKVQMG
ncbi:MAG: glutamate racemase, glutamate racemase [Candidatus Peregrinibacteria bacterium GW2011_GWE2_39_6]|nr:MAG: glutamate racemase, glutamate racemase [Candidatus Peregrinibacteria bacterium GW2011_GWF2_39_17]KKR25880.1 MAG: glutamate racemase, glutamate racemase [Candidatus Peregrinibacteria bacterium GW2011_GWE2_39_6]HCW32423.1 glutamate racemase [Candidatus Peregrinibacteria bacterium]